MTVRSKSGLISYISGVIPDNNAGQISAADVRSSIIDTVESINQIVASGNFNSETPFVNHVRLGGILYVESGIVFPNAPNGTDMQRVPYPGPGSILHNQLDGLNTGDPHTQYLPVSGTRSMAGSLGMSTFWINASGQGDPTSNNGYRGLQFSKLTNTSETINVGSGTNFTFLKDTSKLDSARGVAKAWIRFQGSGIGGNGSPSVLDSYNVSGIKKEATGKFTIIFNSGIFKDNNYVAVGHSNGRVTASSREDFSENTVALSYRVGDDAQKLRSVSFVVMGKPEEAGAGGYYLDAIVNDLVVFGTEPGGSGLTTVTINPTYTA
jgi:hypothetical protein